METNGIVFLDGERSGVTVPAEECDVLAKSVVDYFFAALGFVYGARKNTDWFLAAFPERYGIRGRLYDRAHSAVLDAVRDASSDFYLGGPGKEYCSARVAAFSTSIQAGGLQALGALLYWGSSGMYSGSAGVYVVGEGRCRLAAEVERAVRCGAYRSGAWSRVQDSLVHGTGHVVWITRTGASAPSPGDVHAALRDAKLDVDPLKWAKHADFRPTAWSLREACGY